MLITETLLTAVGKRISHNEVFKIDLKYNDKEALNDVMRYCKNNRMIINNLQVTGSSDNDVSLYNVVVNVRTRMKIDHDNFIEHIRSIKGVLEAEMKE